MITYGKRKRVIWITTVFIILILFTILISLQLGSFSIKPWEVVQTFLGQGTRKQEIVLFSMRLPRIVMAILVGTALAVSGAILQSITKNDLADPGIMGISSGAALAVVMYIYFMNGNVYDGVSNLTIWTMPVVAFFGSILGAVLIYLFAWKKGINPTRLILIGIGINSAFQALMIIFQLRFTTQEFNRVMVWISGSIWGTSWIYVITILPWIIVFLFFAIYKARFLDVFLLGDHLSIGLGVQVEKARRILILFAVALAGVATSVAGTISFLGLISPHIARKLVGPKHKLLLPVSALVGTLLLLISDTIARNIVAPAEIPVGIVVSIIGVPYFLYLMVKE
ncbi:MULTISPECIES: FecCD family ABC transporter permease [Bacillus]|jgi:iron complex transport system permease protein|uniref:FecCD family ABC transporter permease n=1 Tax=Bacillus TaxID=1386 RepID=UPI00065E17E0|nr:iron ABC transporter permease [Bacillus smithii]AKP46559.1 ABC-type Fe3+-siderophore transport systempermease 2 component [Bacillus smithii]MED4885248.1 iron ABC transporter permease [Bacillus smithii]MED4927444.1 iron ABC transporter permease [Bacillus smithii]